LWYALNQAVRPNPFELQESRDFCAILGILVAMKRYLDDLVASDLQGKTAMLTGPREIGKTMLCRQFTARFPPAQYLNWDIAADRSIRQRQSWEARTGLLCSVRDAVRELAFDQVRLPVFFSH